MLADGNAMVLLVQDVTSKSMLPVQKNIIFYVENIKMA